MSVSTPYAGDTTRSPIVTSTIASIVCAFLAIGILASYLPQSPPLGWSVAFLVASVLLLAAAIVLLSRRRNFAWPLFFTVARWVLVLTGIFIAMALFVFIVDGTSGAPLAIMASVLVLAAVDVPLLLGFSVARHERMQETVMRDA